MAPPYREGYSPNDPVGSHSVLRPPERLPGGIPAKGSKEETALLQRLARQFAGPEGPPAEEDWLRRGSPSMDMGPLSLTERERRDLRLQKHKGEYTTLIDPNKYRSISDINLESVGEFAQGLAGTISDPGTAARMPAEGLLPISPKKAGPTTAAAPGSKESRAQALAKQTGMSLEDATAALAMARGKAVGENAANVAREVGLSDAINAIRDRLSKPHSYDPFSEDSELAKAYKGAQTEMGLNVQAATETHQAIRELAADTKKKSEKLIAEKAAFEYDTMAKRAETKENIKQAEWSYGIALNELQQTWDQRNKSVNRVIDDRLKEMVAGQTFGGSDIFKKSAIAIGAFVAAGGTIFGAAALGKKGISMPNVLMPLALRAIDADIESMRKDKSGEAIKGALDLKGLINSNFKDDATILGKFREAGIKYWMASLDSYEARLPPNKTETIREMKDALQMKLMEEEANTLAASRSDIEKQAKGMVSMLSGPDKLKSASANRDYMALNALKAVADSNRVKAGAGKTKLSEGERKELQGSVRALTPLPAIKSMIKRLVDGMDVGVFQQAVDVTIEQALGRFTQDEKAIFLSELQSKLKVFSQQYAKMVESGRITEGDRAFWMNVTGANLEESPLLKTLVKVVSMEHMLKSDVLNTVSAMDLNYRRANWDNVLIAALQPEGHDIDMALANYHASVKDSIQAIHADQEFRPYNVGIVDMTFAGPVGAQITEHIGRSYISDIMATSQPVGSTVVERQVADTINKAGAHPNPAFSGFINVVAADGEEAPMSPHLYNQYQILLKAAQGAGGRFKGLENQLLPHGPRSAARTKEQVDELKAEGRPAVHGGYHTEAKGFLAIDFNFGKDSPGHRFMSTVGKKLGWRQEYGSPNHWVAPAPRE
jgi:transposase